MIYTLLEETYTEDSDNSLSDVRALDDDFFRMKFESSSYEEEITDDSVNWGHLKRKLTDNIVEEKEGAARIKRTHWISCYEKNREDKNQEKGIVREQNK